MTDPAEVRDGYDRVAERHAAQFCDELRGRPLDRTLLAAFAEQGLRVHRS